MAGNGSIGEVCEANSSCQDGLICIIPSGQNGGICGCNINGTCGAGETHDECPADCACDYDGICEDHPTGADENIGNCSDCSQRFKCSAGSSQGNGSCNTVSIYDYSAGTTTDPQCNNQCGVWYACDGSSCIQDNAAGIFPSATCNNSCGG